ncbi:MAG: hypothetical protein KAR11_02600 [Phycisphaerae bacterium]|nr:hypothetical protein [Phycisphaerae bacterium]
MGKNRKTRIRLSVVLLVAAFVGSWAFGAAGDSQLNNVHAGLKLTDIERQSLSGVSDGSDNREELGFYVMMGKVAQLPKLAAADMKKLEAPGYKNLMRDPSRFRYIPLHMPVRIYTVSKMTVKNRKITAHPRDLPIEKPIWEIHCQTAGVNPEQQRSESMILYSSVIPDGLLQRGKKRDGDVWDFDKGPEFVFAGVFYKVVNQKDKAANAPRDYPVFLAWQIEKPAVVVKHWSVYAIPGILITMGLLTGLVLFIKLRGKIKRSKAESQQGTIGKKFKNYKPLRDSDDDMNDRYDADDDKPVDLELTRAAEEYRKQHEAKE